ncbi:MAG: bifunctional riboflavin kinase/FAD synthetase [Clostridiales bacterium]|nr:bifunctional riboflavin kinase/FAD synthetase [Clostridiales bacterium]
MQAENTKPLVIALGFFDGVHIGHAELINMAKHRAEQIGAEPAVLSFDVSPESVVTGKMIPLIGSTETRADIIGRFCGVRNVIIYHFDRYIMSMPWREFIDSLVRQFHAVHFVIGHDFNCGHKGEGTPDRILEYCAEVGLGCDVIPKITLEGITVSSTYIRKLIAEGDIERANLFLGHPYTFTGTVKQGYKLGRRLGTPTINLASSPELLLPLKGVYATKVVLDDTEKYAVTNVGVRPTFSSENEVSIESHILDFEGDLYGKFVRVDFYNFLRPEMKFTNPRDLSRQIESDTKQAREYLEYWDTGK